MIASKMSVRESVWLEAWCATASATNCTNVDSPTRYADECLSKFDERFPAAKDMEEGEWQ